MFLISFAGVILCVGSFLFLPETNVRKKSALRFSDIVEGYTAVIKNSLFLVYLSVSSFQIGAFFSLNASYPMRMKISAAHLYLSAYGLL